MAPSFANLFRMVIVLALALHVFVMYCVARSMLGGFGFSVGVAIVAMAFSLVMLLPLVWAVTLPEWPEIYTRQIRGRRWYAAGHCATCGYQLSDADAVCSECGSLHEPPQPYAINTRTVRMFIAINLLAWIIGGVTAEVWASDDERAFAHEVQAHIDAGHSGEYVRPRRWPLQSSLLVYRPGHGMAAQQ